MTTDNDSKKDDAKKQATQNEIDAVAPTPTTEEHKAPEDNQLNDNERKAENELAALEKSNAEHTTDDLHKVGQVEEQLEYERGQKQLREEEAHADEVTNRQHEKFKPEAK